MSAEETLPGATAPLTSQWTLRPGEQIRRVNLHAEFGGSGQGGISPSARTPNILIFTDPATGEQHGYLDHWDGKVLHYCGEGQTGDQRFVAGNKAVLEHRDTGRALRAFRGSRGMVEYLGEHHLDEADPWYYSWAPATGGGPLRRVIMFRLLPVERTVATAMLPDPAQLPRLSTAYRIADEEATTAPPEPSTVDPDAVDRGLQAHAATQNWLAERVRNQGYQPLSPGPTDPNFDLAWRTADAVFVAEVKSLPVGSEVSQLRLGLGQVLDYADQLEQPDAPARAVLAVERAPKEASRWEALCACHRVALIWPAKRA